MDVVGDTWVSLLLRIRPLNTFLSPWLEEERLLLWLLASSGAGGVFQGGGEWPDLKEKADRGLDRIDRMERGRPSLLSFSVVVSSSGTSGLSISSI